MDLDNSLIEYLRMTTNLQRAHWETSGRYDSVNFWLTVACAALAAVAGTAAFASLAESNVAWIRALAGVFSILAAILASVQGAYRSSQKAELHKNAAVKYGNLRRKLLWILDQKRATVTEKEIQDFLAEWGEVDKESQPLPKKILGRVSKQTNADIQKALTHQAPAPPPTSPAPGP